MGVFNKKKDTPAVPENPPMSKPVPAAAPAVAAAPVTPAAPVVPAEPVATTALAVKEDAALVAEASEDPTELLAQRLPAEYRFDLRTLNRPTPDDLLKIVQALPATEQAQILELVKKLNPKKPGMHTARQGFVPTSMRLFQGTGNDLARPKNLPKGHFYTSDSRVIGDKFVGAVLATIDGRILWPQRPEKGAPAPENASKAPLCVSLDRKEGSRYGKCATCPNSTKQWSQGGCTPEVIVYFMDIDMTGVYELRFSKTSLGAGSKLVTTLQSSENPWDRWIAFESSERNANGNDWCVLKAMPVSDSKDPSKNNTSKTLQPLFAALSKIIEYDVFYTGMANVYDRSKANADAGVSGGDNAADTANEKELMQPGGDNPDYSGGSAKNV